MRYLLEFSPQENFWLDMTSSLQVRLITYFVKGRVPYLSLNELVLN